MRIYVHTPFCIHKCHYCDFNSHVFKAPPWQKYGDALVKEILAYAKAPQFAGRSVSSIFFGGGTPSLAPASMFADVLQAIGDSFVLESDAEVSIEANPGASDACRFEGYRRAGINRISIGVQSFDAKELKFLERIHSGDEAIKAFAMAKDAGFDNINLDLMYALPHQSLAQWFTSLQQAIALQPQHLSCYQLTVEPNTQLFVTHKKKQLAFPDETLALEFFWQTRKQLAEAGFAAYEISNFAQLGKHCQHNVGYWQYDDYIGIGAGAAGKWDDDQQGAVRYTNIRSPQTYMNAVHQGDSAINFREDLAYAEAMGEAVWLGLRQSEGLNLQRFAMRFGQAVEIVYPVLLRQWLGQGLMETYEKVGQSYLRLSDKGLNIADDITASFLHA